MKLIYFPVNKLAPVGGPAGYLWNLKRGLEGRSNDIDFLPVAPASPRSREFVRRMVPDRIKDWRRARRYCNLLDVSKRAPVDLSKYDLVHFHSTEDMYYVRGELERYTGKVVLTSHSPCAYHKELISRLNSADVKRYSVRLKNLEQIDSCAFRRADYVVFPCEQSEEPYYHTWERYADIRDASKYRYLLTGIDKCPVSRTRDAVRKSLGIQEETFLVCYVGRHNDIKGYPLLKELGRRQLQIGDDVSFLIAGRGYPLSGLTDSRWIEFGWTDDPYSLIAASDLFILPNRETYFDLVMLEVLSIGTPILATWTGGNKAFAGLSKGIFLVKDNVEDLLCGIERVRNSSDAEMSAFRADNRLLFEKTFTSQSFGLRYMELLDGLL